MTVIRTTGHAEASDELKQVYDAIAGPDGEVANILAAQSLSPRTLQAHHTLYRELMFGPGALTRAQRELLAVAVSQANECHY